MPSNDNDPPSRDPTIAGPEVYGRAALLLVESLIHGLCENSTLTAEMALGIAERAVDVELDHAEAAEGAGEPMWLSHALLSAIAASLRIDGDDNPTSPQLVI